MILILAWTLLFPYITVGFSVTALEVTWSFPNWNFEQELNQLNLLCGGPSKF